MFLDLSPRQTFYVTAKNGNYTGICIGDFLYGPAFISAADMSRWKLEEEGYAENHTRGKTLKKM